MIAIILLTKLFSGYLSASIIKLDDKWLNSFAQTAKGGVDTSLLLVSLLSGYINNQQYSFSVLAIAVVAIISPIFLRRYKIMEEEKANIKLSMPLSSIKNENYDVVYCDTTLSDAAKIFSNKDVSEIIVVNREKIPIGILSVKSLIYIDPNNYGSTIVCDIILKQVSVLLNTNTIGDALRKIRDEDLSVIAVIDKEGRLLFPLYRKDLLKLLNK